MEICHKDYLGVTFIQLCYVSPDWRIHKSKKLQDLLVRQVAEILCVEPEDLNGKFCWITDSWNNKCLLVNLLAVPEDKRTMETFNFAMAYANGLADGMGYI